MPLKKLRKIERKQNKINNKNPSKKILYNNKKNVLSNNKNNDQKYVDKAPKLRTIITKNKKLYKERIKKRNTKFNLNYDYE